MGANEPSWWSFMVDERAESHCSAPESREMLSLRQATRRHVLRVLNLCGHDVPQASELLDVSLEALQQMLVELEITCPGGQKDNSLQSGEKDVCHGEGPSG